jgi:hypothetical protein
VAKNTPSSPLGQLSFIKGDYNEVPQAIQKKSRIILGPSGLRTGCGTVGVGIRFRSRVQCSVAKSDTVLSIRSTVHGRLEEARIVCREVRRLDVGREM